MNSPPTSPTLAARFPGLRALAWSGRDLYASRRYELLRARVEDPRHTTWQPVAHFRPSLRRRLSATNRFTARLFRDGFHALALLPSGAIIGAVPSSIVTLDPGESEFRQTHAITRGTRPLHITATPGAAPCFGENISITRSATKSTSTARLMRAQPGASPTHSPEAQSAT
jgi:hypothetical protein